MADYARINVGLTYSETSDYSDPVVARALAQLSTTATKVEQHYISAAITTGTTVELSGFSSIEAIVIKNKDSTNYVEVEWWQQRGSMSDTVTFAQAATGDTITDDSTGGLYVSTGLEVGGYVRLGSTATAGNAGPWLVRTAAASVITVVNESTLTADANDAVTISFERKNKSRIRAGGLMLLSDNIVVAGDLAFVANTAACEVEVILFGT